MEKYDGLRSWEYHGPKAVSRLAPRFSFKADAEVTDLESETQIREKTKDLSLFGCGIDTSTPIPKGTRVRVKLAYQGQEMTALGLIVYARPDLGVGIAFYAVAQAHERILEGWVAELSRLPLPPAEP